MLVISSALPKGPVEALSIFELLLIVNNLLQTGAAPKLDLEERR
jgi:hypothetical protein